MNILLVERLKIDGMIPLGALFVLGCATSISPVELRGVQPEEIAPSGSESTAVVADHPPLIAIPETRLSSFGSVTTDAEGRLKLLPADEIRNAENEMYGWLIWVGSSPEPVQWVEKHSAPTGVVLAGGTRVDISEDGRMATYAGSMLPDQGFIHSQWILGADETPGRYQISVSLEEGRTEKFSYSLGHRVDACPSMKVLMNWWRAKDSLQGDPGNRDVTEQVMRVFGTRLARHGFMSADLEDAYWYVMASAARRSDDRSIAYGHIVMRVIADFQGKAPRYSSTTSNFTGLVDFGILFEASASRLDEAVRALADQFAGILTPHARQACTDWWSGQREEEARLEEIRTRLEEEIVRVRERRAEYEKRLELDVGQ